MARKDAYHDMVKNALEKDGWTITFEPLRLVVDEVGIQIDLGAEQQPIAAEKDGEKIAVEIKGFLGPSDINELEKAIGQYLLYGAILMEKEPERVLYLAVSEAAYNGIFSRPVVNRLVKILKIRFILFDEIEGRITQWRNKKNTKKSSNN
jgi:hypothetical protein